MQPKYLNQFCYFSILTVFLSTFFYSYSLSQLSIFIYPWQFSCRWTCDGTTYCVSFVSYAFPPGKKKMLLDKLLFFSNHIIYSRIDKNSISKPVAPILRKCYWIYQWLKCFSFYFPSDYFKCTLIWSHRWYNGKFHHYLRQNQMMLLLCRSHNFLIIFMIVKSIM